MTQSLTTIKQDFTEGLSQISRFWGFPKGMGAIFAVLYLSPTPLSLDEIVEQTGLTKGAVSTEIPALARIGLVHRSSRLGDRKDYYEAEADFHAAVRSILKERQNSEFDRAVASVKSTLERLENGDGTFDKKERSFLIERLQALQDFFNALDSLTDQNQPWIQVGQAGREVESGNAILFVRDHGIGIAREQFERIFGLFNKLDPRSEGTGIGLTLVKRIIEIHGGKIWVESEIGQGTTFFFTLPLPP